MYYVTYKEFGVFDSASSGDFLQLSDASVSFTAGSPLNSTSCDYVVINNDTITEHDENFLVELTASDPVRVYPTSIKNITIQDNDGK